MRCVVFVVLLMFLSAPLGHARQSDRVQEKPDLRPYTVNKDGVLTNDQNGSIAQTRVKTPHLVHYVDPQFPKGRKKSLTCIFSGVVDAQGQLEHIRATKCAQPDYEQSAEQALQQYTFEPATLDGKPTPMQVKVQVNFRIFGRFW